LNEALVGGETPTQSSTGLLLGALCKRRSPVALSLLCLAFVRVLQLPRFHLTDRDDLAIEVVMLNP
jgi:hypothetical protein